MIRALQEHMISSAIESLIENDRLDDFLEFGREKAKEDDMDTESLMKFFDELEVMVLTGLKSKTLPKKLLVAKSRLSKVINA